MQAVTNTNHSPLPPSTYAAIAANRAIDAALALDVSKLDVAEINAEATEAAAEERWYRSSSGPMYHFDGPVYRWDGSKCWYWNQFDARWVESVGQWEPVMRTGGSMRRMTPAEIDAFKADQRVAAFKPLADMAADVAAAQATPDARLDRAYSKLKAQLSRFEQFEDHTKAACISHIVAQVEYAAESLANAADEANEDDKEMHRRLKSGAGYSRRVDNDVPAPGCNTGKAVYGGGV